MELTVRMIFAVVIVTAALTVQSAFADITNEDVKELEEGFINFVNTIDGGHCITDSDCSVVSYCNAPIIGRCKMVWWSSVIIAAIILSVISSVVSCICCL